MSWAQIKHRYTPIGDHMSFWACIDRDGVWCDSSVSFEVAVHWCAMDCGAGCDLSFEQEVAAMEKHGYSIVHSNFLPRLADAGLIR